MLVDRFIFVFNKKGKVGLDGGFKYGGEGFFMLILKFSDRWVM